MASQKPVPSPAPRHILEDIAQKLEHRVIQNRLVLDSHIDELSELVGFADYLFDADHIDLENPTITYQPKRAIPCIHVEAKLDVFGFTSLAVELDFLLIDGRINLRCSIPFPAGTKLEIPGISNVSLREIGVQTGVWLDTGSFEVQLAGTLHVGSSQLPAALLLPVHQFHYQLVCNHPISLPTIKEVCTWFGDEELAQNWPAFLEQSIIVTNLNLAFNPQESRVDLLSVQLSPEDQQAHWTLIPGLLVLKTPMVTLAGMSMTDKINRRFSGSLSCIMSLCGVDIHLSSAKTGSGEWLFEGLSAPDQGFDLSRLLAELIPDAVPLPEGVSDITFSNLGISLSVDGASTSLTIEGSLDAAQAWEIAFPQLGSLSVNRLRLSLQVSSEEHAKRQASCAISGDGALDLSFAGLEKISLSGSATFSTGHGATRFTFVAANPDESSMTIPLGPPSGPALTCRFTLIDISHTSAGWQLQTDTKTSFTGLPAFMSKPLPGTSVSIVPAAPRTWQLTAGRGEFLLSSSRLWDGPPLCLPLPSIHIGGRDLSLGTVVLDVKDWQVGRTDRAFVLETTVHLAVSEEINRVFGIDKQSLKPVHDIFRTFTAGTPKPLDQATRVRLGVSSETGIWASPLNSPFNSMQPDEAGFYHIRFGAKGRYGQVALKMPTFQFSAGGWSCAGEWHIERPLALPLFFIKSVLTSAGLGILGKAIPDALPLMDIALVKNNKLTFVQWLEDFQQLSQLNIPLEVREALQKLESMSEPILKNTPGCLNDYFSFSMPRDLAFEIQTGVGASFALKINTRTKTGKPGKPLRLLLPLFDPSTGIPELVGVQLSEISVGEILGGALFPISVDATCDRFDLLTIMTCILDGKLADQKTSTKKYRNHLVFSDVLAVLPAGIPIPIPLFYKTLGFSYFGWEMVQIESHWHYPLPQAGLFEAIGLLETIKDFIIDKDTTMPKTAPKGFDLPFTVGPNYIQLPSWLGGGVLGNKKGLPQWSIWTSFANLLNGFKFGDPQYFLDVLPVEARIFLAGIQFGIFSVEAGVAVTSPEEFRTRIMAGRIDTEPGKKFAKYLQQMGDGPDKQIAALLPKTPDHPTDKHGLIVLLLSEFDLAGVVNLSLAFGLAAISSKESGKGFATGVQFSGSIGKTLKIAIRGLLLVGKHEMKIVGDSGIWWNDTPLAGLKLTTIVSDTSFSTAVLLTFTKQCTLEGSWLITKQSMSISGQLQWSYKPDAQFNGTLSGTFSTKGLILELQDKAAPLYGLGVEDLMIEIPILPGENIKAAVDFAIPNVLRDGLSTMITDMAETCEQELRSAAQIAIKELEKLSHYELSVNGVSDMMRAICSAVVEGINARVAAFREPKRTIVKEAVKGHIKELNSFAAQFKNHPDKGMLEKEINELITWAKHNKTLTIPILKKEFTIIAAQTLNNLNDIQKKLPNWIQHLPQRDIGLKISGRILQYARNTVNYALNDIADNIGKQTAKMPRLQVLSLRSELLLIPEKIDASVTVTRNNKEKAFAVAFHFTNPAGSTKALADLIVKELSNW